MFWALRQRAKIKHDEAFPRALILTSPSYLSRDGTDKLIFSYIPVGTLMAIWCEMTEANLAATCKSNYKMRERGVILLLQAVKMN